MVRLGLFVIIGTILFIAGVYYVGNSKNIFGKHLTVYADFKDVSGLQLGNNVRFMGINVGSVSNIEVKNDTIIRVSLRISKTIQENLKKDAQVSIGTNGLVGASLININPGKENKYPIEDGDVLVTDMGTPAIAMLETLGNTNETVALLSSNLLEISEKINNGEGLLASLLNDPRLAEEVKLSMTNIRNTSRNMERLSSDLNEIMEEINKGSGVINYLVKDSSLVENIDEIMIQLDSIVVHQMKPGFAELNETIENVNALSQELNSLSKDLSEGKGTLGMLLKDKQTEDNVRQIIENLDSSSIKLDENLMALRRNWLFRKYFKEKEKKKKN